jgi:hypothetical protein
MDAQDRQKLTDAIGDFPAGFYLDDHGIIHYADDAGKGGVIWLMGSKRFPLVFKHSAWGGGSYSLCFCNKAGKLVDFNPENVIGRWRINNKKSENDPFSWEDIIGTWLKRNAAQQFHGRGWAENCGVVMKDLMAQWLDMHSEILG